MGMTNMVYSVVKSPNNKYIATLAYRDGLTFGYYYVVLQTAAAWRPLKPGDPIPNGEVAEVAAEGLGPIQWKGNNCLLMDFDTSTDEKAVFVFRKPYWNDVKIVYNGL
jgi:hypothetical protein